MPRHARQPVVRVVGLGVERGQGFFAIGRAVAVGVFQDENAVALGTLAVAVAVVDHLAHPDAAAMVDVAQRLKTPPRYVIAKGGFKQLREAGLSAPLIEQAVAAGIKVVGWPYEQLVDRIAADGIANATRR